MKFKGVNVCLQFLLVCLDTPRGLKNSLSFVNQALKTVECIHNAQSIKWSIEPKKSKKIFGIPIVSSNISMLSLQILWTFGVFAQKISSIQPFFLVNIQILLMQEIIFI